MKEKPKDLPDEWRLNNMFKVPQQEKTNTTDCWVFICMCCDFILNDCKLEFGQEDITNGNWREKMILSILSVKQKKTKTATTMMKSQSAVYKWHGLKTERYSKSIRLVKKINNEHGMQHKQGRQDGL